jgi:tRNA A37 N6-isopentenylltransferase MiaA
MYEEVFRLKADVARLHAQINVLERTVRTLLRYDTAERDAQRRALTAEFDADMAKCWQNADQQQIAAMRRMIEAHEANAKQAEEDEDEDEPEEPIKISLDLARIVANCSPSALVERIQCAAHTAPEHLQSEALNAALEISERAVRFRDCAFPHLTPGMRKAEEDENG